MLGTETEREANARGELWLSRAAGQARKYAPPAWPGPIDLRLDVNEAARPCVDVEAIARELGDGAWVRYPRAAALERALAALHGVSPERVIVTAGGDDALERICRACLEEGTRALVPTPTFEMIVRSARACGAEVVSPAWRDGAYPVQAVIDAITPQTRMIAVVSPNNPTGGVATRDDLSRLAAAAPAAVLMVDLAYTEFADDDLTDAALELENAVLVRTFSKVFGLAGLRVGYAIGPAMLIAAMRNLGGPFPTSALSLASAERALGVREATIASARPRVRAERREIARVLRELGAACGESQGNFLLADFGSAARAALVWRGLCGLGIAVRWFGGAGVASDGLESCLRITCPGDEGGLRRVCEGLQSVLRPRALLLDMDGVIADVSGSYRRAIVLTAARFGAAVTSQQIAAAKAAGNANNDWVLTQRLMEAAGVRARLDEVTAEFERLYHGTTDAPGLEASERLLVPRETLAALGTRVKLAVVTGRPRADCERFLTRFGIGGLFGSVVCMEDGPAKPAPDVVRLAMTQLGAASAWMVGDTPDDLVAARGAGVVPVGVPAPSEDPARARATLERAGAAWVVGSLEEIGSLLP